LIEYARKVKKVVRLKGGDPFIFGRGAEELDSLIKEGVRFEVIPGITAASGCAASTAIPLTHRDHSHSVRFITGTCKNENVEHPWQSLAMPEQTLVFYMGHSGLPKICENLKKNGLSDKTPVAVISKGTTVE